VAPPCDRPLVFLGRLHSFNLMRSRDRRLCWLYGSLFAGRRCVIGCLSGQTDGGGHLA